MNTLVGTLPPFRRRMMARKIPLRRLVDRRFIVAITAATITAGFFLFFADPLVVALVRKLPAGAVGVFQPVTRLGNGSYLLWPVGILILLFLFMRPLALDRVARLTLDVILARLALLFSAVAIPGLLAALAKGAIGRFRPKFIDAHGVHGFDPFTLKAAAGSFPSGHTTIAFASAVAIGALAPPLRAPLFVLAVFVGISRIMLGVHYPSDAIGGAILGVVFALLIVRIFAAQRLALAVTASGIIRPKAMPRLGRIATLAASILATLRERVVGAAFLRRGEIMLRGLSERYRKPACG